MRPEEMQEHFDKLKNMYYSAPINEIFPPKLTIKEDFASISMEIKSDYHHAAGSLHGSVYFKLLDDSAFFAAQSMVNDLFVFTASFNTYIFKPVVSGILRAEGKVSRKGGMVLSESEIFDEAGDLVAKGSGLFVRSRMPLTEKIGYRLNIKEI